MKENLFNVLAGCVAGARFLDIFSGTGAIGIEALSRGAESAVFVDVSSTFLIKKNLDRAGFTGRATVLKRDFSSALRELNEKHMEFDIIFMDPPYGKGYVPPATKLISELRLLNPQGVLAAEMAPGEAPPLINDMALYKAKRYSTSVFFFYQTIKGDLNYDSDFPRHV
jgi:16S rRNA (guanine(966)-N(2))-methyltransferase RsmD